MKKFGYLGIILVSVFLLSSCATKKGSIPIANRDLDLKIRSFDAPRGKALNCIAEFNAVPLFDFVSNIK